MHALRGASFEVAPGEIGALLGRSGSENTTLLHCLRGRERPDSGEVRVPGTAGWSGDAVVTRR